MSCTVFSYNATVLLIQPNPTQPMDGPNPCPSLGTPVRGSLGPASLPAKSAHARRVHFLYGALVFPPHRQTVTVGVRT